MYMPKKFIFVVFLGALGLFAQNFPIGPPPLIWQNPQHHYKTFDEVKPVIANNGPNSIFLSSLFSDGYAQLQRLNEKTNQYEVGRWTPVNATSGHRAEALEIRPQTQQLVDLNWKISVDNPRNPTHFIVDKTGAQRPIPGKYRFSFTYSPRSWSAGTGHDPGNFYISGSFVIGDQ
jgi:hypothetical protein